MQNNLVFPRYFDGDSEIPGVQFEWQDTPHLSRSVMNLEVVNFWGQYEGYAGAPYCVPTSETSSNTDRLGARSALLSLPAVASSSPLPDWTGGLEVGTAGSLDLPNVPPLALLNNDAQVIPGVAYDARIGYTLGCFGTGYQGVARQIFIVWRDENGDEISRTYGDPRLNTFNTTWPEDEVQYLYWVTARIDGVVAPAGAAWASVGIKFGNELHPLESHWSFLVDKAFLGFEGELDPGSGLQYFDGDTPATSYYTYEWDGEPNQSESIRVGEGPPANPPGEIVDPNCPPPPEPPSVPSPPLDCEDNVDSWQRVWYLIPTEEVYEWGAVVPVITVKAGTEDVDALRITLWANPDGDVPANFDTSTRPDGRWVISYLPARGELTLDGMTESVTAIPWLGEPQSAGYLVRGTGNGPITWPNLVCGSEYLLAIDLPTGADPENVSVTLELVRRFG